MTRHKGLLWFMDRNQPLKDQILQGIRKFESKYGKLPKHCYLHPLTLAECPGPVGGIDLESSLLVLPYHLFLTED